MYVIVSAAAVPKEPRPLVPTEYLRTYTLTEGFHSRHLLLIILLPTICELLNWYLK